MNSTKGGGSGLILSNGPVSPITFDQAHQAALVVVGRCTPEDAALVLEALGIIDLLKGENGD